MPGQRAFRHVHDQSAPVELNKDDRDLERNRKVEDLSVKLGNIAQAEAEALFDMETSSKEGNLQGVHWCYCSWFAKQQPNPSTGIVDKTHCWPSIRAAITIHQLACLKYLLSQGIKPNRYDKKDAALSGDTRILKILLDYGWDINEPEAYCEPPLLG